MHAHLTDQLDSDPRPSTRTPSRVLVLIVGRDIHAMHRFADNLLVHGFRCDGLRLWRGSMPSGFSFVDLDAVREQTPRVLRTKLLN